MKNVWDETRIIYYKKLFFKNSEIEIIIIIRKELNIIRKNEIIHSNKSRWKEEDTNQSQVLQMP